MREKYAKIFRYSSLFYIQQTHDPEIQNDLVLFLYNKTDEMRFL